MQHGNDSKTRRRTRCRRALQLAVCLAVGALIGCVAALQYTALTRTASTTTRTETIEPQSESTNACKTQDMELFALRARISTLLADATRTAAPVVAATPCKPCEPCAACPANDDDDDDASASTERSDSAEELGLLLAGARSDTETEEQRRARYNGVNALLSPLLASSFAHLFSMSCRFVFVCTTYRTTASSP
jgi:hypothetical protein